MGTSSQPVIIQPVSPYGVLLKGRGWDKSLSDEEREVTASPLRAGYGGWPGAGLSVQGSQLFIAAHYYRHCQPPGAGTGWVSLQSLQFGGK